MITFARDNLLLAGFAGDSEDGYPEIEKLENFMASRERVPWREVYNSDLSQSGKYIAFFLVNALPRESRVKLGIEFAESVVGIWENWAAENAPDELQLPRKLIQSIKLSLENPDSETNQSWYDRESLYCTVHKLTSQKGLPGEVVQAVNAATGLYRVDAQGDHLWAVVIPVIWTEPNSQYKRDKLRDSQIKRAAIEMERLEANEA